MSPPQPAIALVPFPDDVEVAVVSHNGRETLPRLLACVIEAGAPFDRIFIYDVGSTDDTAAYIAREWPGVTVRRLEENVGPDPGRNWALRAAVHPYVLLLDADAFMRPDCPVRLREALDPTALVGTVTPIVVHAQDPERLQYAEGFLHFICEAINPWMDRPVAERGRDRRDIGAAPAVALLIDVRIAHLIGLWDDRYFIGKEDGDFCHRLRMAGYRLVEEPRAVVEHRSKPRTAWLFHHQIRNRWHFLLKNYEMRTLVVLAPALALHEVLQLGLLTVKGHLGPWLKAVRGLISWMPGLPAERRRYQRMRTVRDRDLLRCAPLIVRADLAGGALGRGFKTLYDRWLAAYWAVARHLIS
ncbi:MAG TPA: glycosyltransferase [Vicinamibacterales bacterium]|nr:glycosyltransferase [Vicinamibacterales bacterium]